MNLYLQVINGQPVGNPHQEDNMLMAFPGIDLNNLPSGWVPFTRIQQPANLFTSPFQVAVCTYVLGPDGKTWQDSWSTAPMPEDQKAALISQMQAQTPPYAGWTVNTETLQWQAPVPMPTDGNTYYWSPNSNSWVVKPPKPNDNNLYAFVPAKDAWIMLSPRFPTTTIRA